MEVEESTRYALEVAGSHEGAVCPGSSPELAPRMAADSLTATSRALASCPPGELKRPRRLFGTGDRQQFAAKLNAAQRGSIGDMDPNMFSHLMHSHGKEVG